LLELVEDLLIEEKEHTI